MARPAISEALREAIRRLGEGGEQLLESLDAAGERGDPRGIGELVERAGRRFAEARAWPEAGRAHDEAASLLDAGDAPRAAVEARLRAADARIREGEIGVADATLQTVRRAADALRAEDLRGRMRLRLGEARLAEGDPDTARRHLEGALDELDAARDADERLRALIALAEARLARGRLEAAAEAIAPVRAHLEGEEDPGLQARGRALAAATAAASGAEPDEPTWLEAMEALRGVRGTGAAWRLEMAFGRAMQRAGWAGAGARAHERARGLAERADEPSWRGEAAYAEASCYMDAGDWPDADAAIEHALDAAQEAGDRGALRLSLERATAIARVLGQPGILVARLRLAAATAEGERARATALAEAVRIAVRADRDEAYELVDELLPLVGEGEPGLMAAPEALETAREIRRTGRADAARAVALASARTAYAEGDVAGSAEALAEAARMARRAGDEELAEAMWNEVVQLAETFGLDELERWRAERDEGAS